MTNKFICDQCRKVDFPRALRAVEEDKFAHVLVAKMHGLNLDCALCKIFSETILPAVYKKVPFDAPWRLSAVGSYMSSTTHDRLYFDAILRPHLYAGHGPQDARKLFHGDKYFKMGALNLAWSEDLERYSDLNGDGSYSRSKLIPTAYDPELIKHWIKFTDTNGHGLSEISSEALSHADEDYQSSKEVAGPIPYNQDLEEIKLVDCETLEIVDRTPGMQYIALSYVWRLANADMVPLTRPTTKGPEAVPSERSLPPLIPRVIHNAITVVKDLGFRYLWVDQYCIDQSAPKEQIADQVAKMDIVYHTAQLTIIAASSSGALPGVGITRRTPHKIVTSSWPSGTPKRYSEEELTFFTTTPEVDVAIEDSTWFTRGWCFQEAVLSCRGLYFTDREIVYEASGIKFSESCADPMEDIGPLLKSNAVSFCWGTQFWDLLLKETNRNLDDPRRPFIATTRLLSKLLNHYITKELGFSSDTINALRGVMRMLSRNDPTTEFLGGLPIFRATFGQDDVQDSPHDSTLEPTLSRSPSYKIDLDGLIEFRRYSFLLALAWNSAYTTERRYDLPSWTWAGWKFLSGWRTRLDGIALSSTGVFQQYMNIWSVESDTGKVISFNETSTWFPLNHVDNPMFLHGETIEIPLDGLVFSEALEEKLGQSLVKGSFYRTRKLTWLMRTRAERLAPSIYRLPLWNTFPKSQSIERGLAQVFRWSRLTKGYEDTWRVSFELNTQELAGLLGKEKEDEIIRNIREGRWSCLMLHESSLRLVFIIVSWVSGFRPQPKEFSPHNLRTCSRVGLGSISTPSSPGRRYFTEEHPNLPTVQFRLG